MANYIQLSRGRRSTNSQLEARQNCDNKLVKEAASVQAILATPLTISDWNDLQCEKLQTSKPANMAGYVSKKIPGLSGISGGFSTKDRDIEIKIMAGHPPMT